jgi:Got1/Sft2-like family
MQSPDSYYESTFDYRSLLPTRNNGIEHESVPSGGGGGSDNAGDILGCCPEWCTNLIPTLSWRERCIGCGTCMVAGYLLSMGSFWRIADLLSGHPLPFVVNATVGNWIALAGSFFLSGPAAQWRKMWHEKRRGTTLVYLTSLVVTLLVALVPFPSRPAKGLLLLVLMLVQYGSITWYCLSYIPFAQDAVLAFVQRYRNGNNVDY